MLFFGNLFLTLIVVAPSFYITSALHTLSRGAIAVEGGPFFYGFGPATPLILFSIGNLILIEGNPASQFVLNTALPNVGLANVLYFGFAALVSVYNFRSFDPSGEYAGLHGARNKRIALIPHGVALLVGICLAAADFLTAYTSGAGYLSYLVYVGIVFGFLMFGVAYYIALSLWRLNFAMTKTDLKYFLIVLGVCFALTLFAVISSSAIAATAPISH